MPLALKQAETNSSSSLVVKLATLWSVSVASAIAEAHSMQIVRFEDIIEDPLLTAQLLLHAYGAQMTVPQLSKLSR